MKALSPSKKPKAIIITSIAIVTLIGAGAYAYFIHQQQNPVTPPDTQTIKQEQVTSTTPSESNLPSKTGETTPPAPTKTPSEQPEKPTIERAGGDPTIKVVATFQKASNGSCELQLSKIGQQTLTYTSTILVSTSYYSCSFTVARSSLPSGGQWTAVVIHRIGDAATKSDARDLN